MNQPNVVSVSFIDLVVADDELLRTEFDAIVAASFDDPPRPRLPVRRRAAYPLPETHRDATPDRPVDGRHPRCWWRRERSPPPPAAHHPST
jgi:hypothetical protein